MQTDPTGITREHNDRLLDAGDRIGSVIDKGTRAAFGLAFGRRVKVRAHTRRPPRRRKR